MRVGFLGIGQCGSNICEIAELYQYRTCVINTSQEDLDTVQLVKNRLLIGSNGGAGKDRRLAKSDVRQHYRRIAGFVREKFDEEFDMIYVVFSTGGGTGSGMGPVVIDILRRAIPDKTFGAIAVLPTRRESAAAQANSLECMRELLDLEVPTFIVDNDKFEAANPGISRQSLYDRVNNAVVDNLNLLLIAKRKPTKYGTLDSQDIRKILTTPGATVIGVADLTEGLPEGMTLQKAIMRSWDESVYAPMEYDGVVKRLGFVYELSDAFTKHVDYEEITREIGEPLEIFEGFYKHGEEQIVVSVAAGLSFPDARMARAVETLERAKGEITSEKEYSVLGKADTGWIKEARRQSTVRRPDDDAGLDDLEAIFSKYND